MKIIIPEKNRQHIAEAIIALVMAVVMLGANVAGQAVYQWLGIEPPSEDRMIALGDTHFSSLVTTGSMTSGTGMVAGTTVTAGTDLVATGDLTVTDDGTIGDDLTVAGSLFTGEAPIVVAVTNTTLTPLGTYQPVTSTVALTLSATTSIADGTTIGQLLILVNENAADAITVKDAANTALSGDAALGPKDVLIMIWDGADWVEISQANN